MVPVAGLPRLVAVLHAPEALPGFARLAVDNDWRNEVNGRAAKSVLVLVEHDPARVLLCRRGRSSR